MNVPAKRLEAAIESREAVSDRFTQPPDLYSSKLLAAVNLPYRQPPNGALNWSRSNGEIALDITSGFDEGQPLGLPYGKYPRLLMLWVVTEAVRTKSRKLYLGDTLRQFMQAVGVEIGGWQVKQMRDQMIRLFGASFSWTWQRTGGIKREAVQPVTKSDLWWDPKHPDQATLWQSHIVLGQEFFEEITSRPIPLRIETIQAVKSSALGLDLLIWLIWRVNHIAHTGKPVAVSWEQLHDQLGSQHTDLKMFAREARGQLKRIKAAWPGLNIDTPRGRLVVGKSQHLLAKR